MDIGTLMFGIGGDNSSFIKAMEEVRDSAVKTGQQVKESFSFKGDNMSMKMDTSGVTSGVERVSEAMNEMGNTSTKSTAKSATEINNLKRVLRELETLYDRIPNKEGKVGIQLSENIAKVKSEISSLNPAVKNLNGEYAKSSSHIEKANKSLSNHRGMLDYVVRRAVAYVSIWETAALMRNIVQITGEFEKQKVALEGILQNTAAADKLFEQIKSFAVVSPFNFKDLISQAKQLAAYSIPSNSIFGDLKELGDIAAGTGSDMSRLILAFGEVNTQTVLNGRVLRQFTQAGVPLVDELAKHFTALTGKVVTTGDVFSMISKKKVSFEDVKSVIDSMTSKGGIFFQMQEKQAETLSGKLSNLKDKWDIFLASLGETHSSALKGLVDDVANMLEHWQATLTAIKGILLAFGAYKTTMFVANMLAKEKLATDTADLLVEKQKAVAAAAANVSSSGSVVKGAAVGVESGLMAGIGMSAASAATGIGIVLSLLTLLGTAYASYSADQEQRRNETFDEIHTIEQSAEENNKLIDRLKELSSASNSNAAAMQERSEIINKLSQTEPQLSNAISKHTSEINKLTEAQNLYNKTQELKKTFTFSISENGGIKDAEKGLKEAKDTQRNSISELEIGYSRLYNTVKQYKESGIKNFGIEKIPSDVLESINSVMNGAGTMYDKLKKIESLASSNTGVGINISNIFGSTGIDWGGYLYNSEKVKEKQALYNEELKKTGNLFYSLAKEHKIDVRNEQGRAAIAEVIQDDKKLETQTKKDLIQYLHLKWWDGDPYKLLSGWRKDLQDYLGKNIITIHFEDDLPSVIKNIQSQEKSLREEMAQEKPILIKFGIQPTSSLSSLQKTLDVLKQQQTLNPFNSKLNVEIAALESYISAAKDSSKIKETQQAFGLPSEKQSIKPKKVASPKDDPEIKAMESRISYYKKVRDDYNKLIKDTSSESAIEFLKKKGAFSNGMTEKLLPLGDDSVWDNYLNKLLNNIYSKLKSKDYIQKKFSKQFAVNQINSLKDEILNSSITNVTSSIETKMKDIEDELSTYKPQWNLYKQLLGITGDKTTSLQAAFGNVNAKTLIEYQKDEISKALTESKSKITVDQLMDMNPTDMKKNKINDSIVAMVKELQNTISEENSTDLTNLSNLISTYGTIEEKIQIVRNKNNILREELAKNTSFSPDQKKAIGLAIDEKDKKEVQDLQKTAFELNPIYQKLFGDISSMSNSSLKKVIEQSKEFAKNLKEIQVSGKTTGFQYDTGKKDEKGQPITSTISIESYTSFMKQIGVAEKDMYKEEPFSQIIAGFKKIKDASKDVSDDSKKTDKSDGLKMIAKGIAEVANQASSAASSLSNMFDSLGNSGMADTMAEISGIASGIGNVASGIASVNPAQVIQGITGAVSALAQAHDKKLNAAIEDSKLKVTQLKNAYTDLEREIKRQLGAITESQSSTLLSNEKQQLAELQKQLEDENKKKKKNKSEIESTKEEIAALKDKIDNFYEDLMKEQYNIDIKDWATQIGNSLVDAFASGESAAYAFDNTVASIMKSVVKSIISVNIVQPALAKLQEYLFGTNGVATDGTLSTSDVAGMTPILAAVITSLNEGQAVYDQIAEAAKSQGINLSSTGSSSSSSSGMQSLTENTGDIIQGYANNIRLDTARHTIQLDSIIALHQSNKVSFSLMLTKLTEIKNDTAMIATNTGFSKEIYLFMKNYMCNSSSGTKVNI